MRACMDCFACGTCVNMSRMRAQNNVKKVHIQHIYNIAWRRKLAVDFLKQKQGVHECLPEGKPKSLCQKVSDLCDVQGLFVLCREWICFNLTMFLEVLLLKL